MQEKLSLKLKGPDLFIVVGASQSHVPFIRAAGKLGFRTVVFDQNSSAPGSLIADIFHPISTHNVEEIVAECRRLNEKQNLAGVLTYSAYTMPLKSVAKVAETFGLHAFSSAVVESVTDKRLMKTALGEARVPMPQWIQTNDCADVEIFLCNGQGPIVIKPASGTMGSTGVSVATEDSSIGALFRAAAQASHDGSVIVERFHKGREFSVGGISDAGKRAVLTVAEKFSLGSARHFTMSGFAMGRVCEADTQWKKQMNSIRQVALDAVSALDIRNSFFTVDLLLTRKGPLVLEVGILLDAKIDRLLHFSGKDVYEMICRVAAGKGVDWEESRYERGYALKFLFANDSGRLRISRDRKLKSSSNGFRCGVEWERKDGDFVHAPQSIADTLGWTFVESRDTRTACDQADKLARDQLFTVVEEVP